nr:hypothetical protein [Flavobacterium sp. LM4]
MEKECFRNIEMQWLLEDIRPNYHSISDFRKNNPAALKTCSNSLSFSERCRFNSRGNHCY